MMTLARLSVSVIRQSPVVPNLPQRGGGLHQGGARLVYASHEIRQLAIGSRGVGIANGFVDRRERHRGVAVIDVRGELQASEPRTRDESGGPREPPLHLHQRLISALHAERIHATRSAQHAVAGRVEGMRYGGEAIERVL